MMLSRVFRAAILMSLFTMSAIAAGPGGTGGGSPARIDRESLVMLIQGEGLKSAMKNYLQTIDVEKIEDETIQSMFKELGQKISRDLLTPGNYEVIPSRRCPRTIKDHSTYTKFGDVGGVICFDLAALTKELKASSRTPTEEDLMISLAATAFHNHVHHFQSFDPKNPPSHSEIQEYENTAYKFAAYIKATAKYAQLPVLKWTPSRKKSVGTNGVLALRESHRELVEQQRRLEESFRVAVSAADFLRLLKDQKSPGKCEIQVKERGTMSILSVRNENGQLAEYLVDPSNVSKSQFIGGGVQVDETKNELTLSFEIDSPDAKADLHALVRFDGEGRIKLFYLEDEDEHENQPDDIYFSAWCEN